MLSVMERRRQKASDLTCSGFGSAQNKSDENVVKGLPCSISTRSPGSLDKEKKGKSQQEALKKNILE